MKMDYFNKFVSQSSLSKKQAEQFQKYINLLQSESKKINLTTITKTEDIIKYHFIDSLTVSQFVDFKNIESICDIGAGAGFPGIPLKIVFPHLQLILIEVNNKKIRFLQQVIKELGFEGVEICSLDWRTFLRKTSYPIDIFVTRAALKPQDLIRVFSPAYVYTKSTLVYWASAKWEPSDKILPFLKRQEAYEIDGKKRKLVFLSCRSDS